MAKGIIIDVGFASDIKGFINEIESQFKSVNFDKMIGVSKAFDSQIKDVKQQLVKLKNETDSILNGNAKNDATKQMQILNKAVETLTLSFKEMVKVMPQSQSSKITAGLDGIISDMKELSNVCDNAADAVKKVSNIANGKVEFVDSNQVKELKEVLKILEKAEEFTPSNKQYTNKQSALDDIVASYNKYLDILDKIEEIEESSSLSDNKKAMALDRLKAESLEAGSALEELINVFDKLGGSSSTKVKIFEGYNLSIDKMRKELEVQIDSLMSYVQKRKGILQSEISNFGNVDPINTSKVIGESNNISKNNRITVPMDISTKSSTLSSKALELIKQVQLKVENNPLKVRVALVSEYKTKQNTEILEQISNGLNDISDTEIRENLSNLVNNLNKQIEGKLHMEIEVKGSKEASESVQKLIRELKGELSKANLVVQPKFELTDEAKKKLQDDINSLTKDFTLKLSPENNKKESGSTPKQNENTSNAKLKKSLESVTQAINEKTLAFKVEEQTASEAIIKEISSLKELSDWLGIVEQNVKNLSSIIVKMPDFNIKFNQDNLKQLQNLKQIGSFDSLFKDIKSNTTKVHVSLDSSNFDKGFLKVKSSLDKIPEKKDIVVNIKSNESFDNNNFIQQFEESVKKEENTVSSVIASEIKSLNTLKEKIHDVTNSVNEKTNAFKEEQKTVQSVVKSEVNALTPLKNLESTYNNFKNFYDNNDLESEAGAQAALSYYNAYKEALISKLNKKDLQQYTIGKTDSLFTGNYVNYKKGIGDLDLSGLNSQISKYQEIIDKFNQPEVISIVNSLTEAIEKLLAAGNTSENTTKLLKNLNNAINNLGGKNSAEKIEKIVTNLENLQKSIQILDISDSGFVKSLSSILEKGEELKALGEVLKSTKKQIDSVEKAVKTEDNLNKAHDNLEKYENDIRDAVNQKHVGKGETVLYQQLQATKDGLVQIVALIKDANDEYKRFVYTTGDGSSLKVKSTDDNSAALAKQIKQWETYEKLKKLAVPGATNLGENGVTFTPESNNWDQLVDKAREFGIEVGNIEKILRTVDEVGNESFQIFTKLSRITVGMNSNGVLFQKDEVLDANKAIQDFEKDVVNLKKSLSSSFKDDMGTNEFFNALEKISETWKELTFLNEKGLISDNSLSKLSSYFESFKSSMASISLDKISTDKKTPQFIEQLEQAKSQLEFVRIALDKVQSGEAFTDEDIANIKSFISQIRELNNVSGDKGNKLADFGQTSKLLGKIADVLDTNTAMSKSLRHEFEQLSLEVQSFGNELPYDKFKEFSNRFESLKTTMKQTGQTGLSFFDGIIKRAKSMSQSFISMYLSLWDIVRYVRTGVTYIKELDTAFTEMRKVSDESVESLKRFQDASFDIASAVGTTAQQIQNSTADWMRLGESLDEASKSAEASNILLNVSEFESIDEATESLVSMSAAYNELDKMDIIDKLNNVGNNFSISTDGLATALQRSASALVTAGNDMDEAVALVTAGNAVVQNPESVGAGLRTIALRITGTEAAKEELEELGEDTSDFIVQTSAKSQQAIKDFTRVASNNFEGFDILDDNGNFKSTYDILLGISEIYEEILATDKQYGSNMANGLLETLAGKFLPEICGNTFYRTHLIARIA